MYCQMIRCFFARAITLPRRWEASLAAITSCRLQLYTVFGTTALQVSLFLQYIAINRKIFVTYGVCLFSTHQYALLVPSAQTPDLLKEIQLVLRWFRSSSASDSFGNIPVHGKVFRCTWRPHEMNAVTLVKVTLVMTELCFTCLQRYHCVDVLRPKTFW